MGGSVMHRKFFVFAAMFFSFFVVLAAGNAWPQGPEDTDTVTYRGAVMHPDRETLLQWEEEHKNAPLAHIDEGIKARLKRARDAGQPTSLTLMEYLPWNSGNMYLRDQGNCGDCFVWASTGVMEIALIIQNGVKNRLSEQFYNSCSNYDCSKGGWLGGVADWYSKWGYTIPWANTNAAFVDGGTGKGPSLMSCGSEGFLPNYSIQLFQVQSIAAGSTNYNVDQDTSIANIKNILNLCC